MRGIEAPANTDHRLVLLHFKICFPFTKPQSRVSKRPDSHKILHDPPMREAFRLELSNRFAVLFNLPTDDCAALCDVLTKTLHDTACDVAPVLTPKYKPWLSARSVSLLEQKRLAMIRGDLAGRQNLSASFRDSSRRDRDTYLDSLADLALAADTSHDLRVFLRLSVVSLELGVPTSLLIFST